MRNWINSEKYRKAWTKMIQAQLRARSKPKRYTHKLIIMSPAMQDRLVVIFSSEKKMLAAKKALQAAEYAPTMETMKQVKLEVGEYIPI